MGAAGNLWAAPRVDPAKAKAEMSTMIDDMAKEVFNRADRNHNGLLSKREFADAETLLDQVVSQWGRTRTIGKPKQGKSGQQPEEKPAGQSAEAQGNKLAKSNKVTQAEFTFYVNAVVTQADQLWSNYYQMSEAQQKAYQAQRAAMRNQGGRGGRRRMVATPFGYYPY